MKKILFATVMLMTSFAWATPSFTLRVINNSSGAQVMFSGDYDEDIYSCVLELSDLRVAQDEIQATIDDSSPRRCMYIEAPDYGLIDLSKLNLSPRIYNIVINGHAQGTVDASKLNIKSSDDDLDPTKPEYF